MVAAGFSLRFSPSDGCMRVSRKLRNLKDAATQIAQFKLNKQLCKNIICTTDRSLMCDMGLDKKYVESI
jgi:hypothetical protein